MNEIKCKLCGEPLEQWEIKALEGWDIGNVCVVCSPYAVPDETWEKQKQAAPLNLRKAMKASLLLHFLVLLWRY